MFRVLILARDSDTALPLCVYLSLLWGPSGTGFCRGARARGIQGQCPGGLVRSGQEGLFRLPFDSRAVSSCPFSLPLSLPLPLYFSHFRHSGFSVHGSFLMYVLVLHTHSDPFLAAAISPAGTLHHPRTILAPCRVSFPFPFHLLHAPHSPISCRSSLLGFLLLFVLYLPHTLS